MLRINLGRRARTCWRPSARCEPPFGQLAIIHPVSEPPGRLAVGGVPLRLPAPLDRLRARSSSPPPISGRPAGPSNCEAVHARVHGRIDTALNRGRCGLWDWDLARGRIYWSASMYAMLGMQAQSGFISFGDVNALVHPADGDLTRIAEDLAGLEDRQHRPHVPVAQRPRRMGLAAGPGRTGAGGARLPTCTSSVSRSTSRTRRSWPSATPRQTSGCATRSKPCRKPSCCGTPTTAS